MRLGLCKRSSSIVCIVFVDLTPSHVAITPKLAHVQLPNAAIDKRIPLQSLKAYFLIPRTNSALVFRPLQQTVILNFVNN
jgi:hypothetical protein